jgi:hypothetical protein
MASDVINIAAETGRNIIDDDAEAAFEFETSNAAGTAVLLTASTSGGKGLDVDVTGTGAGIDVDVTGGGAAAELNSTTGSAITAVGATSSTLQGNASAAHCVEISHVTAVASPTVAPLKVATSAASGAIMDVSMGLVSTASLTINVGALPIRLAGEDKIVYINLFDIV